MRTHAHAATYTFALCFSSNNGYLQKCNAQRISERGEREEKLNPLEALLLFYQKLEDKLAEYRQKEREALRKTEI